MGTTRRTSIDLSKSVTLAAALGLGSILGLASTAAAETPAHDEEMVLVLPGDTDPQGPTDLGPAPTPDPEIPEGPDELVQPTGHPDPEPEPDLPIGQPDGEPECNPNLGSCDLTDVPDDEDCNPNLGSCDLTDVPDDEDCNPNLASCDLTADPGDPGDDETPDPEVDVDVDEQDADRGALPRTGAGLLVLGAAGSTLTGVGVALRRLARR